MMPISPSPISMIERGMPSSEARAADAISMSVTMLSRGRLRVRSAEADVSASRPRPMNAAPSATPAATITHASSSAIRTETSERIATRTAAIRSSRAATKQMSQTPGEGGISLPLARKKPYQTSEPASQSVAAHAHRSTRRPDVERRSRVCPPDEERQREDGDAEDQARGLPRHASQCGAEIGHEQGDREDREPAGTFARRRGGFVGAAAIRFRRRPFLHPRGSWRSPTDWLARVYCLPCEGSIVRWVYSGVDPVELLRALIRFDTSNPPGSERECVEYVGGVLAAAGIEHRYLALEPDRPNLVARVPGRGDAPPLLLYGHVDVVPADSSEWTHPPFAGELVDGEVWGRGALDMKGGVAMLVTAFLRVAAAEEPPPGDVLLALTSDEEAGSRTGMKFLVEEHPELFAGVRYALSEVGGFTQWHGSRRFVPIQVAEKQRCLIRATVRGAGGHAASVVRGTASAKLGRLLSRLASRRLPAHVTPVARSMIDAMAGALPLHERLALRALLVPALTDRVLDLLGTRWRVLSRRSFTTRRRRPSFAAAIGTNVIPTELSVDLDGRVLPGHVAGRPPRRARGARERPRDRSSSSAKSRRCPVEPDLALLPLLADVVRERDPGCVPIPVLLPGYTDARYVEQARRSRRTASCRCACRAHITTALIHAPDERVPADGDRVRRRLPRRGDRVATGNQRYYSNHGDYGDIVGNHGDGRGCPSISGRPERSPCSTPRGGGASPSRRRSRRRYRGWLFEFRDVRAVGGRDRRHPGQLPRAVPARRGTLRHRLGDPRRDRQDRVRPRTARRRLAATRRER